MKILCSIKRGILYLMSHLIGYPCVFGRLLVDTITGQELPNLVVPLNAIDDRFQQGYSISFAPGGFNIAYTAGPLKIIQSYPDLFHNASFLGSSTGSIVAACACCGIPISKVVDIMIKFNEDFTSVGLCNKYRLNSLLGKILIQHFPIDAYLLCSGRLVIGYTKLYINVPTKFRILLITILCIISFISFILSNILISTIFWCITILVFLCSLFHTSMAYKSKFLNNKDLINTILCSSSIPLIQDCYPMKKLSLFSSIWMLDAGFSLYFPVFDIRTCDDGTALKPTIRVNWKTEISRKLITTDGKNIGKTNIVGVFPDKELPLRLITIPNKNEINSLIEQGAKDFKNHLITLNILQENSK